MCILLCNIEIFRHSLTVMGAYEIADDIRKSLALGYSETFLHVIDNDLRTLDRRKAVVRITATLIFREEGRSGYLANVMIKGTYAHEQRLRTNLRCYLRTYVTNRNAMLKSARCDLRQTT